MMDSLSQDVRHTIRGLRRSPGFTAVVVLTLALGIGANAAVFSVVDSILLRPLPFGTPGGLVILEERTPRAAPARVSPPNYVDWTQQNHTFAVMAAVATGRRTLTGAQRDAQELPSQSVTPQFFDLFGVTPIRGRTFVAGDANVNVAVVSERLWSQRFKRDETLVGRTISLDQQLFTVIGIAPQWFQILSTSDVWTPLVDRTSGRRDVRYLQVVARLKPNVGLERAQSDMAIVAANIGRAAPNTNAGWGIHVFPLREALVSQELRTTSFLLGLVVGVILLMTCANVGNLLLVRAFARKGEITVRSALGATRSRILQQLLVESMVLASLGGIMALALTWVALRLLVAMLPSGILPPGITPSFDERVVVFSGVVAFVTAWIFTLAPAHQIRSVYLARTFSEVATDRIGTRGTARTFAAVAQVACATLLLISGGLLLRTVVALGDATRPYRPVNVVTFQLTLPFNRYASAERRRDFYNALEREIGGIGGVRAAAIGGDLPLDGASYSVAFEVLGESPAGSDRSVLTNYQIVSSRYFEALNIPIVRGRPFSDQDDSTGVPVCIVNEEFARRHLQTDGDGVIGRVINVASMEMGAARMVPRQVVGIIRQIKTTPAEEQAEVQVYVPIRQNPWFSASVVAQTNGDAIALVPSIRAAVARVDKDQPVRNVRTMELVAADAIARPRLRAVLVGVFAALAFVLAVAGVFGVSAFAARQRTREFGIRMALGAQQLDVLRLGLSGGVKIVGAGVAGGLIAAVAVTRVLASLLFGVEPLDPVTFWLAPTILGLTCLAACTAPALRAAHMNPAVALRAE